MPSLTCFNLRFTPSWLTILLSSLFMLLFIRLGYWQIQRADEKRGMIQAELAQAAKEPLPWDAQQRQPNQYQRIKLKGHFLSHLFLLDNQHQQHQFGYDALSPLLLADDTVILIDRGWLLGDSKRLQFPKIHIPKELVRLQGSVYFPSKNNWLLGANIEIKNNRLAIIENIDTQLISHILQKKVYPFIMRLDKHEANGFVREWTIVSMPVQRHLAYAFQWFAMSFSILVLFIALNLKRHNEQTIP
jgi:surfeit locus 1 family protein